MAAKVSRVIFLDRDGTLNPDPGYIASVKDYHFFDGALGALSRLSREGWAFVIVTNQSGVDRGIIGEDELEEIHAQIAKRFREEGIRLLGIYCCPHLPEAECECRKPKTSLYRQACEDLELGLDGSVVVGDSVADMEAGRALGLKTVLVRTGQGRSSEEEVCRRGLATHVVDDLAACARLIRNGEE